MERRLAAILAADVVGYSRMIRADEEGTLAALNALRQDLIDPKIAAHRGRVVKLMGDGMLAEFPSVVEAVRAAVETQQAIAERNFDLPKDKRIEFRVGVNLGDVVIDGEDIHGDGVNIAARLERLAEPGGLCVSGAVYEQVRNRTDLVFQDLGDQEVKNIDQPVRVWSWPTAGVNEIAPSTDSDPLPLPDKPSIAVLPFDNMSGDPEQEYFADGITEDLITALSKFRWFFVTARNSTFTYKGTSVDITQVGRELGVWYVLEGSVRKAGNRLRISAQLIEAETGNHVWAERYDRDLKDIFELQDEITRTICAAVEPELFGFERERALHRPTESLGAWGLFQRGVALLWRVDRTNVEAGVRLLQQAVEIDPEFGQACGYLAFGAYLTVIFGWADDREATLRDGVENANRALMINQRDYFAHFALGRLHTLERNYAAAIRELETSIDINPNFAHGYYGLAAAHVFSGSADQAIKNADLAIRLSPNDPLMWAFLANKGLAHFALDDLDTAIELLERCCQFPTAPFIPFAWLAATYVEAGRDQDASKALEGALRRQPSLSISYLQRIYKTAQGKRAQRLYNALRKAGLPEN